MELIEGGVELGNCMIAADMKPIHETALGFSVEKWAVDLEAKLGRKCFES